MVLKIGTRVKVWPSVLLPVVNMRGHEGAIERIDFDKPHPYHVRMDKSGKIRCFQHYELEILASPVVEGVLEHPEPETGMPRTNTKIKV